MNRRRRGSTAANGLTRDHFLCRRASLEEVEEGPQSVPVWRSDLRHTARAARERTYSDKRASSCILSARPGFEGTAPGACCAWGIPAEGKEGDVAHEVRAAIRRPAQIMLVIGTPTDKEINLRQIEEAPASGAARRARAADRV